MNKIERAFLWADTKEVSGGKCKINWESVCRPTNLGGLGILHIDKFARALRLRWPWYEWKQPKKLWVGSGTPCNEVDMVLFYASTTIYVGNGKIAPFWESPRLNGRKPKDIAPLIFHASPRKKWNVEQATRGGAWISKIKMDGKLTIPHIREFISHWRELTDVNLSEDVNDSIVWNLTKSGEYTTTSACKSQFFGATNTLMNKMV
jgi:hypothetical protein